MSADTVAVAIGIDSEPSKTGANIVLEQIERIAVGFESLQQTGSKSISNAFKLSGAGDISDFTQSLGSAQSAVSAFQSSMVTATAQITVAIRAQTAALQESLSIIASQGSVAQQAASLQKALSSERLNDLKVETELGRQRVIDEQINATAMLGLERQLRAQRQELMLSEAKARQTARAEDIAEAQVAAAKLLETEQQLTSARNAARFGGNDMRSDQSLSVTAAVNAIRSIQAEQKLSDEETFKSWRTQLDQMIAGDKLYQEFLSQSHAEALAEDKARGRQQLAQRKADLAEALELNKSFDKQVAASKLETEQQTEERSLEMARRGLAARQQSLSSGGGASLGGIFASGPAASAKGDGSEWTAQINAIHAAAEAERGYLELITKEGLTLKELQTDRLANAAMIVGTTEREAQAAAESEIRIRNLRESLGLSDGATRKYLESTAALAEELNKLGVPHEEQPAILQAHAAKNDPELIAQQKAADDAAKAFAKLQSESDALMARLQPLNAEYARHAKSLDTLAASLRAGIITQEQFNAAEANAQLIHRGNLVDVERSTSAMKEFGNANARCTTEMIVLGHEVLVGNWRRFPGSLMVMTEYSEAFRERLKELALGMATLGGIVPVAIGGPILVGLAAAAAAVALVTVRALTAQSELRTTSAQLAAYGNTAGATSIQLRDLAISMAAVGGTRADNLAAITSMATNQNLRTAPIASLASVAPEFAAIATGGDTAQAAQQLTTAFSGGYEALKKLSNEYNLFSPQQAEHIRNLMEEGKSTEALAMSTELLSARFSGAAGSMRSDWGRAVHEVKIEFDALVDRLATYVPTGLLKPFLGQANAKQYANTFGSQDAVWPAIESTAMLISNTQKQLADLKGGESLLENLTKQKADLASELSSLNIVYAALVDRSNTLRVTEEANKAALAALTAEMKANHDNVEIGLTLTNKQVIAHNDLIAQSEKETAAMRGNTAEIELQTAALRARQAAAATPNASPDLVVSMGNDAIKIVKDQQKVRAENEVVGIDLQTEALKRLTAAEVADSDVLRENAKRDNAIIDASKNAFGFHAANPLSPDDNSPAALLQAATKNRMAQQAALDASKDSADTKGDNETKRLTAQANAQITLAKAYETGNIAMVRQAELQAQIDLKQIGKDGNEKAIAAAMKLKAVGDMQVAVAKYTFDTNNAVAAETAMAAAWIKGADAARQQTLAENAISQIRQSKAEGDPAAQARIVADVTAKDLATRQAAMAQLGSEQQKANSLAQIEYNTLTLTDTERAKTLAVFQAANDLQAKGVNLAEAGTQEYLKQVDAMAEYKARLAENTQAAQGFASSIGGAFGTMMTDPAAKFSDVWGKAFKDIQKQIIDMTMIKPFENWLSGNITQMMTGAPPSGGGTPVASPSDIGAAVAVGLSQVTLKVFVTNLNANPSQPGVATITDTQPITALTYNSAVGTGSPQDLLYALAKVESGASTNPRNNINNNGTFDVGTWQINSDYRYGYSVDQLKNTTTNLDAALQNLNETAGRSRSVDTLLNGYNTGNTGSVSNPAYVQAVKDALGQYSDALAKGDPVAQAINDSQTTQSFRTFAASLNSLSGATIGAAQNQAGAAQITASFANGLMAMLGGARTPGLSLMGGSSVAALTGLNGGNSSGGLLSGLGGGGSNNTLSGLYDGSYLQSILQPDSYAQSLFGAGQSLSSTGKITSLASGAGGAAGSMSGLGSGLMGALGVGQGIMGLMSGQGGAGGVVSNASSIIGGGLGIASAMGLGASLGPIGMGVGLIGGLIGNLIGGGQKSVGPNADADLNTDNGRFNFGAAAGDNGGDPAQAKAAIDQVTTQMNAVLDKYKLTVSPYWGGISSGNGGGGGFKDAASLVADIIGSHVMSGDGLVGRAAANTSAKDVQGLTSDLDFASTLQKSIDAIHDYVSASDEQKRATNATTTAVIDQYQADQARADGLGLRAEEDKKISSDITFQLQQMAATEAPMTAAQKAVADFQAKLTGLKNVADTVGASISNNLYLNAITAQLTLLGQTATPVNAATQAVKDFQATLNGLTATAAAFGSSLDKNLVTGAIENQLNTIKNQVVPQISETVQQIHALNDQFGLLKDIAKQAGINLDPTIAALEKVAYSSIVNKFNNDQISQLNSAGGKDYLNQLQGAANQYATNQQAALDVQASQNSPMEIYNAAVGTILQGLSADQMITALSTYGDTLVPLIKAEEARRKATDDNTKKLSDANTAVSFFTNAITSLNDYSQGLLTGNLSPLSPLDQYNAAKSQYSSDKALALTGDQTAIGKMQADETAMLTASKDYYASSEQYYNDFREVQATNTRIVSVAQQQLDSSNQIVATLQGNVTTDLQKITAAITALQASMVAGGTAKPIAGGGGGATITPTTSTAASLIANDYRQYLNRAPTTADLQYWTNQYNSGTSLSAIGSQIGNSVEADYVASLGRTPNAADIGYWQAQQAAGVDIAYAIANSPEAQARKNAFGNAFDAGNVIPFARGGIVDRTTLFGMAGGQTGMMGEAGPEAIMPLRRSASGHLGVVATNDSGALIAEIRALRAEVASLKAVTAEGARTVRGSVVEGNDLARANGRPFIRSAGR